MRPKTWYIFAQFIFLLLTFVFATETTPPLNLVIILDASGSMRERIDGKRKMDIARSALKTTIKRLPDDWEVGLIAYGHRAKSDCNDIETLVPPTKVNQADFSAKLEALIPMGKTPITNALHLATDLMRNSQKPGMILWITDGLENCGGDPRKAVEEAREAGITTIVHIIGIDLNQADDPFLESMAQTGGGLYLNTHNAGELEKALGETIGVTEIPHSVISLKAVEDGELTDALVRVYHAGTDEEVAAGRTHESPETNPRLLPVIAGTYDVEVVSIHSSGKTPISLKEVTMTENQTVEKVVDFTKGDISILVTRNGELSDAAIHIYSSGTRERIASGRTYRSSSSNPQTMKISPGKYDVVISSVDIAGKPEKAITGVDIGPRTGSEYKVDFDSGTLRVFAIRNESLIDATVSVYNKGNPEPIATGRTYADGLSNPLEFQLSPGEFIVTVEPVNAAEIPSRKLEITIQKDGSVDARADFGVP